MRSKGEKRIKTEQIKIHSLSGLGMRIHAESAYPHECCGLLFGSTDGKGRIHILESLPMENQAGEGRSGTHYLTDPFSIYRWEQEGRRKGMEIVGFYHSHPDREAVLSGEDETEMIPEQVYVILSAVKKKYAGISAWKKQDCVRKAEQLEIRYEGTGI